MTGRARRRTAASRAVYAGYEPTRRDPDDPDFRAPRPKARKNLRDYCGGHTNRPHRFALAMDPSAVSRGWRCYARTPREVSAWEALPFYRNRLVASWVCRHREVCGRCGKVQRHYIPPQECPARPTGQEP